MLLDLTTERAGTKQDTLEKNQLVYFIGQGVITTMHNTHTFTLATPITLQGLPTGTSNVVTVLALNIQTT